MGLPLDIFEFDDKVPSTDEVTRAIQSEMVDPIHFEGTLAMSDIDEEEAKSLKESQSSLRLSTASMTLTDATDRRQRGKGHVSITVSLRGKDLVVVGNHRKIWDAACKAIAKLGGARAGPPLKT